MPEVGAAPSRITNLARGLKDSGIDVDVLTCMPNYPKGRIFEGYRHRFSMKENIDGIDVYRYWTYACNSKNPIKRAIAMLSFAFTMWFFAFKFRLVKSYDRIIIQSPPLLVASSTMPPPLPRRSKIRRLPPCLTRRLSSLAKSLAQPAVNSRREI